MSASRRLVTAVGICLALVLALGGCSRGADRSAERTPTTGVRHDGGMRVAFVGDSYSFGTAATSVEKRWTSVLSSAKRWNELNVAIPGMGYVAGTPHEDYPAQVALVAKENPQMLIVSGGWNDVAHRYSTPRILAGLRATLAAAKRLLPGVPVVVIAPIGPATPPPPGLVALRDQARAVVTQAGARYVDLDFPLTHHPEWISSDGLHPNDAGYAQLARLTKAALGA